MEGTSLISAIGYSELLVLCIVLTVQHIYTTLYYKKRDNLEPNNFIFGFFTAFLFIFVSELIVDLGPVLFPQERILLQWSNAVCFVAMLVASLLCLLFCYDELKLPGHDKVWVAVLFSIPAIVGSIFSLSSIWNGMIFTLGEGGYYNRGPYAIILYSICTVYYGLALIFTLTKRVSAKDTEAINKTKMLLNLSLPIVIGQVVQIFTIDGIATLGYMYSLSATFVNLVIANSYNRKLMEEKKQYSEIIQSSQEKIERIEYERLNDSIVQAKNAEVIRSLADDFIFVCYVNLTTNEATRYQEIPEITKIFEEFPSSMLSVEKLDMFLRKVILPEDWEKMQNKALNPAAVASLLKEGKTTENFMANIDGEYKYYRLKMAVDSDNPNGIVYGIYSVDEYVRQKKNLDEARNKLELQAEETKVASILKNLANDYECVSYLNISGEKDDILETYRDSEYMMSNVSGWAESIRFSERIKLLASHITTEKERTEFLEKMDRNRLKVHFLVEEAYYVDLSMAIGESRHYYQIKLTTIKNVDGVVVAYVVGLKNIDESVKERNELIKLEQERFEQQAFTNLFIDTYTAAYYVNLKDYTYVQYKLKDYLKDRFVHYSDFVRTIANYIENNVYDEDREMMYMATNPEIIREKLQENAQYAAVYRDKMGDEPSYRNMIITRGHDENHIAVGFIDVSDQFRKERKIQENLKSYITTIENQQAELEEANKSKTNFLFNMSHDIRTPMNAIIGYTDLAKEHINETERALRFLDKIALSGEHLLKLINEILDMSRIEGGKLHSEMVSIDVCDSAGKIVDICKEEAFSRKIDFNVDFSSVRMQTVSMDELHVNQVLLNVLSNAIKYSREGGKVSFVITELPASVSGYKRYRYVIEDDGIGMSEEFLEHIFDSFSRERTSTVSGIQGTGLGMAIVKKLVDYMDGTIEIESKTDVGTKVSICFQYKIPESEHSNGDEGYVSDGKLMGRRILFVDDNEINRDIVRALLEEEGMIMHEAMDGKDAIRVIEEKGIDYYDCILMDIQMPVMNGYETTEYLRTTYVNSQIPIIALSANAFEEDRKKSLAAGMNAHVSKPVSAITLYKTLTKYIQIQE